MPRRARIDAAGALQHVIGRGIERRSIFRDDADRNEFLRRLGDVLIASQTHCYAWTLLPNHFHLLLIMGPTPLATVMQRLLSGYAGAFNRRHRRIGQIFHNRYKSILCQEDAYLRELVRYIHLNPLRAGLVQNADELEAYPYSGHSVLMERSSNDWQAVDTVLSLFGSRPSPARRAYRLFVEKGLSQGQRPELTGGGLIRSMGGWGAVKALRGRKAHMKGDERILGDSDFVQTVLAARKESLERRYRLKAKGIDLDAVIERVAETVGIDAELIRNPGKQPLRAEARSIVCYLAVGQLRMSTVAVSKVLGISPTAVTKAATRGKMHAQRHAINLDK